MSDVTMTVKVDAAKWEKLSAPGAIERAAAPIVSKYAFVIEGKAKQGAPVDTGYLKNSLQAEEAKTPANWTVSDGAEYGIYQEMGTRFISPQFFLTKASESTAEAFFDELIKLLA